VAGSKKTPAQLLLHKYEEEENNNTIQDKTLHEGGLKNTAREMTYEEGQSTERLVGGLEMKNIAIGINLVIISEGPEG